MNNKKTTKALGFSKGFFFSTAVALTIACTGFVDNANANAAVSNKPAVTKKAEQKTVTIKGLRVVSLDEYKKTGTKKSSGITISDLDYINVGYAKENLNSFLGKTATSDNLNAIIKEIILISREEQQPVVDVYFPEQDITDGYLTAIVNRAKVGKITVFGNEYFDDYSISKEITAKSGDFIYSDQISNDIKWLNSNPYRSVDVVFKAGEEAGTTDIILKTLDTHPLRFFAGYDNYGAPAISENQFNVGFSYGDLFGLEHELLYNYAAASNNASYNSHTLQYSIPLAWRDKVKLTGAYSKASPDIVGGSPFTQDSENYLLNFEYIKPVYSSKSTGFKSSNAEWVFGADYKKLANSLEFGGTSVFSSEPEIVQAYAKYSISNSTRQFLHSFSGSFYLSPGDITSNNSKDNFRTASAGTDPSYAYLRALYDGRYTMENGFGITGIARGQYAFDRLLSSEQIALNGPTAVRGFGYGSIRKDNALISTIEITSPYVGVIENIPLFSDVYDELIALRDRVSGYFFTDFAWGYNHDDRRYEGNSSMQDLATWGFGARFGLGRFISGKIEYGKEFDDEENNGIDEQLHMKFNIAY